MKRHITQKAIDQVAAEFGNAVKNRDEAICLESLEYWKGKRFAIIDTFAYLTGQEYVDAEDMLIKRYNALAGRKL